MNMKRLVNGLVGWFVLLLLVAGCASGQKIKNGDMEVSVDGEMRLLVSTPLADQPLMDEASAFSSITVNGQVPAFTLVRTEKKTVKDAFGKGICRVFHGEAAVDGGKILEDLMLCTYDRFPSTVIARAAFTNETGAPVSVEGWTMDRFAVNRIPISGPSRVSPRRPGPTGCFPSGRRSTRRTTWA